MIKQVKQLKTVVQKATTHMTNEQSQIVVAGTMLSYNEVIELNTRLNELEEGTRRYSFGPLTNVKSVLKQYDLLFQ